MPEVREQYTYRNYVYQNMTATTFIYFTIILFRLSKRKKEIKTEKALLSA